MNLAQMLAATVTPLSDYEPSCQRRQRETAKEKAKWKRNTVNANVAKHQQSITAYRAVWVDEVWLPTALIERRLGRGRSCCLPTLRKWEKDGLIEWRWISGSNGRPNRRLGLEWRWL